MFIDVGTILNIIWKGLLIGIVASAPMGPVGVLCVQRTLNKGRWYGFVTGCGAALSDLIYALITGLGMSFVFDYLTSSAFGEERQLLQEFPDGFSGYLVQSTDYFPLYWSLCPLLLCGARRIGVRDGHRIPLHCWRSLTLVVRPHLVYQQGAKQVQFAWHLVDESVDRWYGHGRVRPRFPFHLIRPQFILVLSLHNS